MAIAKKHIILIMMSLLVLPLIINANPIGHILIKKGKIKIHRKGEDKIIEKLHTKIDVMESDEIQSGNKTRAELVITKTNDNIMIYGNTLLKLNEVTPQKNSLFLNVGKAKFNIKKYSKAKKIRFRIKTVNATVGVRGTDFIIQTNGKNTKVVTIEGEVELSSLNFPQIIVLVSKNSASVVEKNRPPTAAIKIPKGILEKIVDQDTDQAWQNISFEKNFKQRNQKKIEKAVKEIKKVRKNKPTVTNEKERNKVDFKLIYTE